MDENNSTKLVSTNDTIAPLKKPSRLNKFTALLFFAVSMLMLNGNLELFACLNLAFGAMTTDKYNKWQGTPPSPFLIYLPYIIAALTFIIGLAVNIFFWIRTIKKNKGTLSKGEKWALSAAYLISTSGMFLGCSVFEVAQGLISKALSSSLLSDVLLIGSDLIISIIFVLIYNFYLKNKFEKNNVFRKMSMVGAIISFIAFFLIFFNDVYMLMGFSLILSATVWF